MRTEYTGAVDCVFLSVLSHTHNVLEKSRIGRLACVCVCGCVCLYARDTRSNNLQQRCVKRARHSLCERVQQRPTVEAVNSNLSIWRCFRWMRMCGASVRVGEARET